MNCIVLVGSILYSSLYSFQNSTLQVFRQRLHTQSLHDPFPQILDVTSADKAVSLLTKPLDPHLKENKDVIPEFRNQSLSIFLCVHNLCLQKKNSAQVCIIFPVTNSKMVTMRVTCPIC